MGVSAGSLIRTSAADTPSAPFARRRPSIAAAQSAAGALDKQDAEELPDPADTTPFRHQE